MPNARGGSGIREEQPTHRRYNPATVAHHAHVYETKPRNDNINIQESIIHPSSWLYAGRPLAVRLAFRGVMSSFIVLCPDLHCCDMTGPEWVRFATGLLRPRKQRSNSKHNIPPP